MLLLTTDYCFFFLEISVAVVENAHVACHTMTYQYSFLLQMLSHEAQVLKQGLTLLGDVLTTLVPRITRSAESPVSILLHEVALSGRPQQAMASMQLTPLLHGIVAVHAYVGMFLHVCKVGQVRRLN